MSLVHGNQLYTSGEGARTHVLIIGVGSYPFLRGGAQESHELSVNLGQLTSPPVSARHLADWILSTPLDNPDAPLGSLEMLLSPAQDYQTPSGNSVPVEVATMANIKRAFGEWDARCDAHVDNVAIFYFCGHGIQKEVQVLLPADFGASDVPWSEAIDFDKTYRNMSVNKAFTQIYFIDACREMAFDTLTDPDFGGQPLRKGKLGVQDRRIAPKIYATSQGRQAFGPPSGVSYFTAALVDALNGKGAKREGAKWGVFTESLGSKIRQLVQFNGRTLDRRFQQNVMPEGAHADNRIIHRLTQTPNVDTVVFCQPAEVTAQAEFSIRKGGAVLSNRPPAPGEWQQTLAAGAYEVVAHFDNGAFHDVSSEVFVEPPVSSIPLEVV